VALWRTRMGQRTTEHPSEAAARASVGELPQRWAAGAAGLRTVRIYPPDDGVELVDFAMEEKRAARALLAVERATRERDNKIDAATTTWERRVAQAALAHGDEQAVASAAGITISALRAIVRRHAARP